MKTKGRNEKNPLPYIIHMGFLIYILGSNLPTSKPTPLGLIFNLIIVDNKKCEPKTIYSSLTLFHACVA